MASPVPLPLGPPKIAIIGGGIVGLSASLFLSSHSIPSVLLERRPQTSTHPRSRSVNARTMEIYRSIGIADAVRAAGAELAPSGGIYSSKVSLVDRIEKNKRIEGDKAEMGKFPKFLEVLGPEERARGTQDCVEPVLVSAARSAGGDVRFGVECLSFTQDDSGVNLQLRDRATGEESTMRVAYVIAADGAGSPIRQALGVKSTGVGRQGYLLNILFKCDLTPLVKGRYFSLCQIERPDVRGLFTSINNSDRWVFHLSYDPSKGGKVSDFSPEKCERLLRLAIGIPDAEIEIESILPWEPTVRVVEQLQHGRIFLAGDAAHVMPPWGGQGANSGVADVHNLAWKLAYVLQGHADPKLLQSYDQERLPVDKLVADESGKQSDEYGLFGMKRDVASIWALAKRVPRVIGYGYTYVSDGMVFGRDGMPWYARWTRWLTHFLTSVFKLAGAAGTRVPHIWVTSPPTHSPLPHLQQDNKVSTLDFCTDSFILFAGSTGQKWCDAAQEVGARMNIPLKSYVVGGGEKGDLGAGKGEWEGAAGISREGMVLVRPDGFVCWRCWGMEGGDLERRLEEVMVKALGKV